MQTGIFDADNALPFRMNRVVFNGAAGTYFYNKPAGLIAIEVEVEGGGGGNGSTNYGYNGGYSRRLISASLLPGSVRVTLGSGGASGSPGVDGGTTSFGSLLSATGGAGGNSASSFYGGRGAGGDINLTGGWVQGGTGLAAGARLRHYSGGNASGVPDVTLNGAPGTVVVTEYLKGAA